MILKQSYLIVLTIYIYIYIYVYTYKNMILKQSYLIILTELCFKLMQVESMCFLERKKKMNKSKLRTLNI